MKFAFPGSEALLDGLLSDKEFDRWTNVARLTEMHFYSGRFGWSHEEVSTSYKLSARFNILVEEYQGLNMCVVTNHNLLQIAEDINGFSSTDNFWCFAFERAVKKYTSRPSNCKHIEVTYARAEARREFLKQLSTHLSHENYQKPCVHICCKLATCSWSQLYVCNTSLIMGLNLTSFFNLESNQTNVCQFVLSYLKTYQHLISFHVELEVPLYLFQENSHLLCTQPHNRLEGNRFKLVQHEFNINLFNMLILATTNHFCLPSKMFSLS